MRIGIVGDVHGRDLGPVQERFRAERVDQGICLGDFDRAHIARQMMEMQRQDGWYVVPGNHDFSHVDKVVIHSGTMSNQGIDSGMMWREWDLPANSDVREYVCGLLTNKCKLEGGARRIAFPLDGNADCMTVIMHGAYAGDYQGEPADLWTRLQQPCDHAKNFDVMERKGYRMMIRGHDHDPVYTYKDPVKGVVSYDGGDGKAFNLFKNRMHTINPGAYFSGNFAVIDTAGENPVLTYHKL